MDQRVVTISSGIEDVERREVNVLIVDDEGCAKQRIDRHSVTLQTEKSPPIRRRRGAMP
jgi:hypothetical protein